jgi:NAD(P)-dependent dehydrogenase (short-subunit alcohol dehydrogenase family)
MFPTDLRRCMILATFRVELTDYCRSGDEMNKVLNTNVTGVHLVTQAFLPLLEKSSLKKIVNV